MKAIIINNPEMQITLSIREAKYLRSITQNYLGEGIEPDEEVNHRRAIFESLEEVDSFI